MINHDDLAAFQIQTDYTRRFVANSVMWSVKMTPGIRKRGCGAQHCQSVVGWGAVGWSAFLPGPCTSHLGDFQGPFSLTYPLDQVDFNYKFTEDIAFLARIIAATSR